MKIMAVDYGDARTGLAVCDRTEFLASPIGIIEEKSLAILVPYWLSGSSKAFKDRI